MLPPKEVFFAGTNCNAIVASESRIFRFGYLIQISIANAWLDGCWYGLPINGEGATQIGIDFLSQSGQLNWGGKDWSVLWSYRRQNFCILLLYINYNAFIRFYIFILFLFLFLPPSPLLEWHIFWPPSISSYLEENRVGFTGILYCDTIMKWWSTIYLTKRCNMIYDVIFICCNITEIFLMSKMSQGRVKYARIMRCLKWNEVPDMKSWRNSRKKWSNILKAPLAW